MQILLIILLAVIGIRTLTGLFFYQSSILTIFYDSKKWITDKWVTTVINIKIIHSNIKKWAIRNWKKILGVTIGGIVIGGGVLVPRDEPPPGDVATYYFDYYDSGTAWPTGATNMDDGNTGTYAQTGADADEHKLTSTSYVSGGTGTISKVELRAYAKYTVVTTHNIYLRPIFSGSNGDEHLVSVDTTGGQWEEWVDITSDTNAPSSWAWSDILSLDCMVTSDVAGFGFMYVSKVDIRVTYSLPTGEPVNTADSELPVKGATGVNTTPHLRINVTDPNGNLNNVSFFAQSGVNWTRLDSTTGSLSNGSYWYNDSTCFSMHGVNYTWSANSSDSDGNWDNDTFYFTIANYNTHPSTTVNAISPYEQTSSPPLTITATGASSIDNVSLYYRFTDDNSTWHNASTHVNATYDYMTSPHGICTDDDSVFVTFMNPGYVGVNLCALAKVDISTMSVSYYKLKSSSLTTGIVDDAAECIYRSDTDKVYVIGESVHTGYGVCLVEFDPNSGSTAGAWTHRVNLFAGDTDSSMYGGLTYGHGYFWVCSGSNVARIHPVTWDVTEYDYSAGLSGGEYHWMGCDDDNVWMTSHKATTPRNGRIIKIDPDDPQYSGATVYQDANKAWHDDNAISEGYIYLSRAEAGGYVDRFNISSGTIDQSHGLGGGQTFAVAYLEELGVIGVTVSLITNQYIAYLDPSDITTELWKYEPVDDGLENLNEIISTSNYTFTTCYQAVHKNITRWENDVNWSSFGTDTSSPWSWDFTFPQGDGYYQFASIGKNTSELDEYLPWEKDTMCNRTAPVNSAPTVDPKSPLNASTWIEVDSGVTCQVYANDTDGNALNVTWATNESDGVNWVNKHTNISITANTTPSYKFTDFTDSNTKYWWKVYVNDGTVNISEIYHFTTETYRNTTVRTDGVDYFVWLGDNVSAWHIYQIINSLGFDEGIEYIAVWRNQ